MIYLLDANVFIEAKNRYYRFSICPGFWDWLESDGPGKLLSIRPVREELLAGKDDLKDFIETIPLARFADITEPETQSHFAEIVAWIDQQHYTDAAKVKFLSGADPWLVAHAISLNEVDDCTVVTHEQSDLLSKRRIFIPDMCNRFDIKYCDTFDYLEYYNVAFKYK